MTETASLGPAGGSMTFAFFLTDLISSGPSWIAAVMAWFAEMRNGGGQTFGLILLLAMCAAVPVALWWSIYQTLLVWLRERPESDPRRR